jgi:hypothetical protein
LVELNLRRSALKIWVFFAEITDEFILLLDDLLTCDGSVDLGAMCDDCFEKCHCGDWPRYSRLTPASDEVIP